MSRETTITFVVALIFVVLMIIASGLGWVLWSLVKNYIDEMSDEQNHHRP